MWTGHPIQDYEDMQPQAMRGYKVSDVVLGVVIFGAAAENNSDAGIWVVPAGTGTLTITRITGQRGTVHFKTASGETGSFNLATHKWSIER